MSERIAAEELHKIGAKSIREAIAAFRAGERLPRFGESTHFDVLVGDKDRYPPKQILGLAAAKALGLELNPKSFTGGDGSTAFRVLFRNGYEIATKPFTVGDLDATFSIGRSSDRLFLLLESRGPSRNTEYLPALDRLLAGLTAIDGRIETALLASSQVRHLRTGLRQLALAHDYPIRLQQVSDLTQLRHELTAAASQLGRDPGAKGGGNRTRRLRLELSFPRRYEIRRLGELLGQGGATPPTPSRSFRFSPRPPKRTTRSNRRRAIGRVDLTHLHDDMQAALYRDLVAAHGENNVGAEHLTCSGRPADVIVETADGYEIYEIKTQLAPRDCVREALGQLIEYAYWPGSPRCTALWVVGPTRIDSDAEAFVCEIAKRLGLPLKYMQQEVD